MRWVAHAPPEPLQSSALRMLHELPRHTHADACALQKPWAKPAGIPPGQLPQQAAASESRPASARADAPAKRGASLTSALPALKLPTSSFRQQQEGTVVNPLTLMGSSAAAQRTPTRHSLQVMNCRNSVATTLREHLQMKVMIWIADIQGRARHPGKAPMLL